MIDSGEVSGGKEKLVCFQTDGCFPDGDFLGERKRIELKALVFAVKGKLLKADLMSAIG